MKRFFKLNGEKGFTLLELLVVIAIIGILSAFLTTNYITVRQRARDAQRKADLRQMQAALEQYRSDQLAYPTPPVALSYMLNSGTCPSSSGSLEVIAGTPSTTYTYMSKIPCDPSGSGVYNDGSYYYNSDGTTYTLAACLENGNDQDQSDSPGPLSPPGSGTCSTSPSAKYYILNNP